MAPRAPIIAGKTVILLQVQDTVDAALKTVKNKLRKFSSTLSSLSFELFQGGIATALPLGLILRDFKSFEDEILFLRSKLKGTAEPALQSVEATIRQLGRTTSFTAQEVAEGAVALAQAGFSARELEDSLQPVLDLARGGRIDLFSSAAIIANTLRVFSLEATKASEVASQFVVASRLGTLNVLDLKESLKEVVGTLNVLNIDLPTSLALVTQLAQSSLKGTKAGTSLNTALLNLAQNQDVLQNVLGITVADSAGNLRPIIDILDELDKKVSQLGDVKRVAVLQRLFNIRGGRAVTGILRDIQRVRELAEQIRNSGDEARKAAVLMDSGFGGALRRATSAVQDLSIEIGKIVSGPLAKLLEIIPPLANSLQEVFKANPALIAGLALIPPALIGVGIAGITASFALNKIASAIGLLRGVLVGVLEVIIRLASFAIKRTLLAALSALSLVFVETRQAAASFTDAISSAFQRIAGIGEALRPAIADFKTGVDLFTRGFGNLGLAAIQVSLERIVFIIKDELRIAFATLYNAILPVLNVFNTIGKVLSFIGNAFGQAFSSVGLGNISIVGILSGIADGLVAAAKLLVNAIQSVFDIVIQGLQYGIRRLILALSQIQLLLKAFEGTLLGKFLGVTDQGGLINDISSIITVLGNVDSALSDRNDTFRENVNRFGQFLDIFNEEFKNNIANAFKSFFSGLPKANTTPGTFTPSFGATSSLFSGLSVPSFQDIGAGLAKGVSALARTFPGLGLPTEEQLQDQIKATKQRIREERAIIADNKRLAAAAEDTPLGRQLRDSAARENVIRRGTVFEQGQRLQQLQSQLALRQATVAPKRAQISDISRTVSAVVGSVQQTRLNKIGAGKDKSDKTNDLLSTISEQLGPTPQDSYLKKLVENPGGLALQ